MEEVISQAKLELEDTPEGIAVETQRNESVRGRSAADDEGRRTQKRAAASPTPSPEPDAKRAARLECAPCRLPFDSVAARDLHRFAVHPDDARNSLHDITLIDRKYHDTNRAERLSYRCDRCGLEFLSAHTLEAHAECCETATRPSSASRDRRDDFFAKLDLRNRALGVAGTLTPPTGKYTPKFEDAPFTENGIRHVEAGRDFADIQSILNVTSAGGLLERWTGTRAALESTVLTPPDTGGKERDHEDTHDSFAAEFRRMKLRGEFPCRLCPAKFPNLRALKGHNRVHLNGTGPGPYRCNMCPHASLDKAALVRHMRTHNGDRPYECAVCNYAFTTKANCERHLRNRHAKITREDVKRSIIYHPSEDPNNDELNTKITRDEVKRSLSFQTPEPMERRNEISDRDTPLSHFTPSFITDRRQLGAVSVTLPDLPDTPAHTPRDREQPMPRIKVKGIGQLTQMPDFAPPEPCFKTFEDDAPVDLSTGDGATDTDTHDDYDNCDVLDLSKKKRDVDDEPKQRARLAFDPDPASVAATALEKAKRILLAQQQRLFENSLPKIDSPYYATQFSQLYAAGAVTGIPGLGLAPSFPVHPYLLQNPFFSHPTDSQELTEEIKQRIQKEIIRGLSLSGGRLVAGESDLVQPKREPVEEHKPARLDTPPAPPVCPDSPRPPNNTIGPVLSQTDSVKMVIKNGILMPKQKQRRYRTERPFSCSQCSARFTLRSNMERHVKQQHPQHWSVRRPGVRAPPYGLPETGDLADRDKPALLGRPPELTRSPVRRDSDEVADNEEDEDDALVIDEEDMELEAARADDHHAAARRAAHQILLATRQRELSKDFDLKIAGNLINKPAALIVPEKTETGTDPIPVTGDASAAPAALCRSDEDEEEEGLVASTSEGNNSGSDENKSESDTGTQPPKKKSAYSLAPNRVSCQYCNRKFPWSSSLRRHVLTHTGQKPFKCPHCPLLFTTKSNCDRHLLRKHGGSARAILAEPILDVSPPPPNSDGNPALRNVPDRPFKCASCPTSTFSSMDTLKKHMSSRHQTGDSQPGSPNPEKDDNNDSGDGSLSFKCHLCDASFNEREGALRHLAGSHAVEYEQLVNKGALDAASDRSESADDDDRGKFPDHANRKVVCAFCVRRFWSAEDLRRHMRTHSGERPFACDLCRRRFTLKHSMLRHRKKHRESNTDDEEPRAPTPNTNGYRYTDEEVPSNVNNNNSPPAAPYDKLKIEARKYSAEQDNDQESGGDLIGNLLGIRDKSIINKLLQSADVAAKFLGVNK
ncbi:Ras-responsive element-binding protein 1 [Eumeta japonica]|uniref:Ras-responsive element-binding protein 1 n=1 Tax=Eumeta variegata TaxID=151549 RepID=A0A4C1V7E5_EUMVA|nr:Ras-responsive element-binding protein 1 [Eumeta japonica]